MKKVFIYCFLIFLCSGFIAGEKKKNPVPFATLETLEYRLHYSFMNAGEAVIEVHPKLYLVNNKVCYKATVTGRSTGAFELMLKIKDTWGTYIDTSTYIPQRAYRDIEEGGYRLKEFAFFDFSKNQVSVDREGKSGKKTTKVYEITPDVQDIVSGFYYLRTLDYGKMKVGDIIKINAFFEDKLYDFKVKYLGTEIIDTKFGDISAIKLSPLMPDNQLFDGEESIKVYLSNDKNKIPLKVEAEMFVGAVEMDIKNYKGLKYPICFTK